MNKSQLAAMWMKRQGTYDYAFLQSVPKSRIKEIREKAKREAAFMCDYWSNRKAIGHGTPLKVSKHKVWGLPVYDGIATQSPLLKGSKMNGKRREIIVQSAMVKDTPEYPYHIAFVTYEKKGPHRLTLATEVKKKTADKGPEFVAKKAHEHFSKPHTRKLFEIDIAHELSHVIDKYEGRYDKYAWTYDWFPYSINPLEMRARKIAGKGLDLSTFLHGLTYRNTPQAK